MRRSFLQRHSLLFRAALAVAAVVAAKVAVRALGWEILTLNPLFTGIVAANVFLMGFLLGGVLADYKESERIPGEIAAILETFVDDADVLRERTGSPEAARFARRVAALGDAIQAFLHRRAPIGDALARLTDLNASFGAFEALTQANFVVRLKQEQHVLRRIVLRIQTIRDTSFLSSGYRIAETTTALLMLGLVLAVIEPFHEALFVVGLIAFLMTYLILLIRDLDDPFGYADGGSSEDVSLEPLESFLARLALRGDGAREAAERSERRATG